MTRPRVARACRRAWIALGFALIATVALADERVMLHVAAGPLGDALEQVVAATGLQLLYDPALVRGRTAPALDGAMTAGEALSRLLAGSGVEFRFTAPGAAALFRPHAAPPRARAPSSAAGAGSAESMAVIVEGQRELPAHRAMSALKSWAPTLETPADVQVLPEPTLRDLQVERLERAVEQVSGIAVIPSGLSSMNFALRGFVTAQYYVDGVRVSSDLHQDGFRELANIDRIEVVKGPSSILYGRSEPGGLINVIPKEPQADPLLAVGQQTGSFGHERTTLDSTGPIGEAGALRYRFNAAYEEGRSYREFVDNHRVFVAPTLTWEASPAVQATAYAEYLDSRDFNESGLPLVGNRIPDVPIGRSLAEPGASVSTRDVRSGLKATIALSDRWTLRPHLDVRWLSTPAPAQIALDVDGLDPSTCTPDQCPVRRQIYANPVSTGHTYYFATDLLGAVDFGHVQHSLLIGAEAFDVRGRYDLIARSDPSLTIDLYAPQHTGTPVGLLATPDTAYTQIARERWYGLYVQDSVALTSRLSALAGARYDVAFEAYDERDQGLAAAPVTIADTQRETALRPRFALLWRALPGLSLYTSYVENFGVTNGRAVGGVGGSGAPLPPETAQQWELGLKGESQQQRASVTLSLFDLTKHNVAVPDRNPARASLGYQTVTGAARSRGVELDLQGELLRGLTLSASAAYLDARIIRDVGTAVDAGGNVVVTAGNTGHRMYGAPQLGGSFWGVYEASGGSLQGLRLGIGAVARGERMGDNANDYQLPGYTKWCLMSGYRWRTASRAVTLQLNVDNVANARYYESLYGSYEVVPGAPRSLLASVRVEQ